MDSHIQYGKDGHATSFVGPDAVNLYRCAMLQSSLRLYAKCGIIPTRGMGITKLLALSSQITGKKYKRGDALKAADDLGATVAAYKASIPAIGPDGETL